MLRRELPARFAQLQFFFQPADIVDQVLNFGQPAPIDVRVSGPDQGAAFALASQIAHALTRVAGVVDSHVFQVPNAPALTVDVDRALADTDRRHATRGGQQRAGGHELERADRRRISGWIRATA